jgi:ubiquinone/menaquinone biosynthesis C-methylase UbiE
LQNIDGITAYDRPDRVARYDADMQLLHPNRSPMIQAALGALPLDRPAPLRGLDLGAGTGYFTRRFLEEFPQARVVAIDGAAAMIDLARERLGDLGRRVDFREGDFRRLSGLLTGCRDFDVAFSSYALHHLDAAEKTALVRDALSHLRDGGWFVNADLLACDCPALEPVLRSIKIEGIVTRARGNGERFRDGAAVHRFLQELTAEEGDQPLPLSEELAVLRGAGLARPTVLWLEYDEAVILGRK